MRRVPDIRQRDDFSCGAASLAALLSFHGRRVPRWVYRLANPVRGMQPETVEAVLYATFGRPPLIGSMSTEDLRHLTRTGRPVLCPVVFGEGGHWVCVYGVARGRVHFHCPTGGPDSLTVRQWLARWRDDPPESPYQRYALCGWPGK